MFICMILASVFFVIFAFFFLTAGDNLAKALIVCNVEIQTETIKKTQIEMNLLAEQIKKSGQQDKKKLKQGKALKKKQDEAKKQLEILKKGKISTLDIIPLAGYRMIQLFGWDGTSDVVKKLNRKCIQFKEKKEAINYTYGLGGRDFTVEDAKDVFAELADVVENGKPVTQYQYIGLRK